MLFHSGRMDISKYTNGKYKDVVEAVLRILL